MAIFSPERNVFAGLLLLRKFVVRAVSSHCTVEHMPHLTLSLQHWKKVSTGPDRISLESSPHSWFPPKTLRRTLVGTFWP